jgi:CheY-like chemotaxis protein
LKIRILKHPDEPLGGFVVDRFQRGEVYDVGTQLAELLLAAHCAEAVIDPAPAQGPAAAINPHGVVLVIDDDADLRDSIAALLRMHGYTVMVAGHGRDGLARLRDQRPDVILLDLNMPVMDGWEFRAEQARLADKQLAAVPVLLCTAAIDAEAHAADLRAAAFIEKPLDMDVVLRAVQTLVGATNT